MRHALGVLLVSMLLGANHFCALGQAGPVLLTQVKGPACQSACWETQDGCSNKCNSAHQECRANCELESKSAVCLTACNPLLKNCHADCSKTYRGCKGGC